MHRVLIVDDQEDNRLLVEDALEGQPYELEQASSGEEAIEKVTSFGPHLILLDVQMPGLDGYETLRRLKANPTTANIPVVMLTALGMDSQVALSLNEGAVDHITKPFSAMVLRARLKAFFRALGDSPLNASSSQNDGTLITVVGAKGGVGTTTVATNLAAVAALENGKVTLLECRPDFGSVSSQLGLNTRESINTLWEQDILTRPAIERTLIYHPAGFNVLPGPGANETYTAISPNKVDKLLDVMVTSGSCVIADVPPCPTEGTEALWRRSSKVLLVLEPDVTALEAAQVALDRIRASGTAMHKVSAVVVNRAPRSRTLKIDEIQKLLGCRLVGALPFDVELCTAAQQASLPAVLIQANALLSSMLREIASDVLPSAKELQPA